MLSSQCESDSQAESSAHNPFFTKDVLESFDNDENNCAQKDDKYGDNPQQGDASQHDAPKSDDGKNGDDGNADHNDHDDSDEGNDNYNDVPRDLIAFLAMVQKYKIDFLPTMWQSALGVLGKGGFGMVNQAPISTTMNFAFKRFHGTTDSGEYLLPLISEVSILSQPLIQDHPNIVDLEGVCWEIKPSTQEAVPVLVFEKGSCGDLKQFMKAGEGMNMSFDDRIKICVDIGGAIMTLHTCGVIYGDIKPSNVLVFRSPTTGTATIKVADFGHSTLISSEAQKVTLPKSRPWNAPEHRYKGFPVPKAKLMDVYSFGLLCLWVLFGNRLSDLPKVTIGERTGLVSFEEPPRRHLLTMIELLKENKGGIEMEDIANKLIDIAEDLGGQRKTRLRDFFGLTIARDPEKRTCDIGKLVEILSQERIVLQLTSIGQPEATGALSMNAGFRIVKNLTDFVNADYRVRKHIRLCLENSFFRNQTQPSALNIAFQIAFCYKIGFGVESDKTKCDIWLRRSKRIADDLDAEKQDIQQRDWRNERLRSEGFLTELDLISEYRARGLEVARNEYEREIDDMVREFGRLHLIPLILQRILGDILDGLGNSQESKARRMSIQDQIEKSHEIDHPYYLRAIEEVIKAHMRLEEWKEAQELLEALAKIIDNTVGAQNLFAVVTTGNLAYICRNQGRLKEAEKLEIQAVKTTERLLGPEHPHTLSIRSNLATTLLQQGRLKEAEELHTQINETRKRVLGRGHPDTLISMIELASTYSKQGLYKEAEELEMQAVEISASVLGPEHPHTLTIKDNHAVTFWKQKRWEEAEDLHKEVMETRKRVLGQEHPDTLTSVVNFASEISEKGQWKEAEELQTQVLQTLESVLGREHPHTLAVMSTLATTLWNQGPPRWKDAEVRLVYVMDTRKRVLGHEHPETLAAIFNFALALRNQERLTEAERLFTDVMKLREKVLGSQHPDTLAATFCLASMLLNRGCQQAAEKLFQRIAMLREAILNQGRPDPMDALCAQFG